MTIGESATGSTLALRSSHDPCSAVDRGRLRQVILAYDGPPHVPPFQLGPGALCDLPHGALLDAYTMMDLVDFRNGEEEGRFAVDIEEVDWNFVPDLEGRMSGSATMVVGHCD